MIAVQIAMRHTFLVLQLIVPNQFTQRDLAKRFRRRESQNHQLLSRGAKASTPTASKSRKIFRFLRESLLGRLISKRAFVFD